MKVLFLDIDGVLNCDSTKERIRRRGHMYNGFMGVDREILKRFQDWQKTRGRDVKIVLSSSWREHEPMMDELRAHGIEWIDVTPRIGMRGDEVDLWLFEHREAKGIKAYAILDDIDQFSDEQQEFFVKTHPSYGVTLDHLERIEAILGIEALSKEETS